MRLSFSHVIASDWALNARRTEQYASCSRWCICVSISVWGCWTLVYGPAPIVSLPLPVIRPLPFIPLLFWYGGGRSSSVPVTNAKFLSIAFLKCCYLTGSNQQDRYPFPACHRQEPVQNNPKIYSRHMKLFVYKGDQCCITPYYK